jgi:Cu2+-exporting ATPase
MQKNNKDQHNSSHQNHGHDHQKEQHDHEHQNKNQKEHKHAGHNHHHGHGNHENHGDHHGHGGHGGHDHSQHHAMMIKDFRKRFWISLAISVPILILSPMIQGLLGVEFSLTQGYDNYLLFTLSTIVFFYGGWPFLTGLVDELKKKQPGMMTLIAVAITVAWGYSSATTFGLEGSSFFWELATLIDIMLLGHWIEMKSVMGASKSLQKLVALMPSEAHRLKDGKTEDVKVGELKKEDKVLVRPGEKIPVDGVITEGSSNVNEAMVTGESKPVKKEKGKKVIGGTINGNGSLTVSVKQVGEEAYLNKVIKMVRDAQSAKSKTQNLADRIAFWLTIVALTIGFGTLATWLILGKPFVFALERMATVMVITCPHALGLAVPLVVAISTSISAQKGLLIRNRTAFENSRKITLLAFDKTGTLTKGNFGVTRYGALNNSFDDKQILTLAGALEAKSEHPLAMGIMQKVKDEDIEVPEAKNFNAITGKGIEAEVDNKKVKVVSPGYVKEKNIEVPDKAYKNEAETVVFVFVDDKLAGFVAMDDEIREESYEAVKTLKENGLKLYMMTGDNEKVAKSVSDELGLDGYFAGVLPDQKLEKVKAFQQKGEFVAMTGDGINDAPALATADVGIAVGSGTDIAAETADIILVNSNPKDIASLVLFGKATYKKMIQNFVWATGYNVVAIPLAAGVLYSEGILISPAMGAVLMSLSTVIVAINAQLLKRKMNTNKSD